MPAQVIDSIAQQLESYTKNVVTCYEQETILLDIFEEAPDVIEAGSRNIRIHLLARPGGKFSQGTADFDDMGRGSGSKWEVGTFSTNQYRFAVEISKLAEYGSDSRKKSIENVVTRELAEATKMFKRGLDCLCQGSGNGQLDTISSISGTTLTVSTNANLFYFNQDLQVYPAGLASASRGLCTVTAVDPLLKTITVNALPGGTIAGDALVINISQGAGGANPVSLQGLTYNHVDSSAGSWNNIPRSSYPELLKTPHVAAGGATITPGLRRLMENKLRRVMGTDFDPKMIAYMGLEQEASWEDAAITVTTNIFQQVTGDSSPDMLKRNPPKTFGGLPIKTSIHAAPARVDLIVPKYWGRGVTKTFGQFELGGQKVFHIPGTSGAPLAGYWTAWDVVFNVFMRCPRFGAFADGLAIPANY